MYARFSPEELTLRDVLAIDRTAAANERTLLGYVRTALALVAAGAATVHFFDSFLSHAAGWILIASVVPLLFTGTRHYLQRRRDLIACTSGGAAKTARADADESSG